MQQQWPQLTTDITDMKRQQVAATTTGSAAEEGNLLDGLRSRLIDRAIIIQFFSLNVIQYTNNT